MAGFDDDVVYGTNVDFTGTLPVSGQINQDGELLIGAAVAPFIRSGLLTGSGGITITNGPGSINIDGSGSAGVTSVIGTANRITSSGGSTPVINIALNYVGQTSITTLGTITTGVWNGTTITVANGGTGAVSLTGVLTGNGTSAVTASTITQYGTVVAGASNAVSSVAPSATSGVPYISQGAASNPTFGTAVVAGGGTGNTTFTAYSVICAGTTATGVFQNVSGLGSSGQVLTSNGASNLPTWQPAASGGIPTIGSSTDNALVRWDGATGTAVQNGVITEDDTGNLSQSASVNGASLSITTSNTSNTASSNALQQITVAGTSAGDAFTTYTISGTTNWSIGTDNSVSGDPFVVAASTALGTTNVISATTGGAVSFVLGNVDVTKSSSGADVSLTVSNTSNTATSSASHYAIVAGGTAADAQYNAQITGGQNWTWGLDNSDSDAFAIASSSALGTTNVMHVATTGEINFPLQSAFLAYASGTQDNVTGDNTLYTVLFATEIIDQNSDFASSTFTSPVTGVYYLNTTIKMNGLTASHTVFAFTLVTSNRTYLYNDPSATARDANNALSATVVTLADMDAADTATVQIQISGGTKVADLSIGTTPMQTWFAGNLEC